MRIGGILNVIYNRLLHHLWGDCVRIALLNVSKKTKKNDLKSKSFLSGECETNFESVK